eukprot:3036335-Pyramimonas_sp.AAC.1
MGFLHEMLNECARAGRSVVFVLDEFDLFATRSKQAFLYTILNAMHHTNVSPLSRITCCTLAVVVLAAQC